MEEKRIKDIESELEFLLERGISVGHRGLSEEHSRRVASLSREYKQLTGDYYQRRQIGHNKYGSYEKEWDNKE